MKKKVISLLLTAAMATTMFAGCGSSSEENTTADNNQTAAPAATEAAAEESTEAAAPAVSADGKIAMITDSGDITDESFNQITWETCVAYGDKNGIEYQYYKPAEDTDEERINAIDLAVADGATVIVMPGYLFGPAIAEEQDLYPDVSFIAVDVTEADIVDLSGNAVGISDNVYICSFQEEQAGYLAGYAAVKDGYTSLGFLGGIAVPAVIRYGYGYIQGINDAAEEMGVDVNVKYYYGGQFYVEAAEQYDGKVIGVDVDQRPKIGDLCITSAMKGLGSAVNSALDAYFGGNWASIGGKSEQLGLAQGDYLGLPTDTDSWGFTTFTVDEYNTVLDGLKDGSITVSNDTENQPEVGSHVTVDYVE